MQRERHPGHVLSVRTDRGVPDPQRPRRTEQRCVCVCVHAHVAPTHFHSHKIKTRSSRKKYTATTGASSCCCPSRVSTRLLQEVSGDPVELLVEDGSRAKSQPQKHPFHFSFYFPQSIFPSAAEAASPLKVSRGCLQVRPSG